MGIRVCSTRILLSSSALQVAHRFVHGDLPAVDLDGTSIKPQSLVVGLPPMDEGRGLPLRSTGGPRASQQEHGWRRTAGQKHQAWCLRGQQYGSGSHGQLGPLTVRSPDEVRLLPAGDSNRSGADPGLREGFVPIEPIVRIAPAVARSRIATAGRAATAPNLSVSLPITVFPGRIAWAGPDPTETETARLVVRTVRPAINCHGTD